MKPITRIVTIALITATFLCNCAPELDINSHKSTSKAKGRMVILPANIGNSPTLKRNLTPGSNHPVAKPTIDNLISHEEFLFNEVETILVKNGFDVINRKIISHLLNEKEFSGTGLTSKSNRIKLGKLANANTLATVEYRNAEKVATKILYFKLLDLETGRPHYIFNVKDRSKSSLIFWLLLLASFIVFIILGITYGTLWQNASGKKEVFLDSIVWIILLLMVASLLFGIGSCVRENKDISINHYLHLLEEDLVKQWNNPNSESEKKD